MLFEKGYSREEVIGLFRFIDWLMSLPEELAADFKAELKREEEAGRMRYVTSIERLAKQEGIEEGKQRGKVEIAREDVIEVLEVRFGEISSNVLENINRINDVSVLKRLHRNAIREASPSGLSQFHQWKLLQNLSMKLIYKFRFDDSKL